MSKKVIWQFFLKAVSLIVAFFLWLPVSLPFSFIPIHAYADDVDALSFEGFEDFVEEDETSDVVVKFGREDLGVALATFNDDELRFDNPEAFFQLLRSHLKQATSNEVYQAIEQAQPTNMDRLCKKGPICGFLTPDVLGIIFNRNKYTVQLFINPKYLVKRKYAQAKFLDDSTAGFSVMSQFQHNLSGDGDKNVAYSLNNRLILGEGNWDFLGQSNFTYVRDQGVETEKFYQFQELFARWREDRYKAQIGLQDTTSTLIIPQLRIMGVSFQTDNTLLQNSSEQIASPIEVSLANPSYVEIYRNGSLLSTQYYPPGNFFLDTSLLPQGAYPVEVRIRDIIGNTRTRNVFFVKTNALPLSSLPEFYVSYGRLQSLISQTVIPRITNIDVITLESDQRLHKFFGISEHLSVFEYTELLGELEFITQLPWGTFIVSGGASNFQDYGAGLIVNTNVYGVAISTIYRRIWANENSKSKVINQYLEDSADAGSNLGLGLSYSWKNYDFSAAASTGYNNGEIDHGLNLGVSRTFQFGEGTDLNLSINAAWDSGDSSIIASMTFNFAAPYDINTSLSMTGQYYRPQGGQGERTGTASVGASRSFKAWGTENQYGIQATSAVGSNYLSQSLSSQSSVYTVNAQTSAVSARDGNSLFYNMNAFTSLVYTPWTNFDWTGSNLDSGVVVRIEAPIDSSYAVFGKNSQLAEIKANKSYFIPMANFKRHTLQVLSQNDTLTVEEPERSVVLYDGNVHTIIWKAREAFLLIGSFVNEEGEPLANYDIDGGIEFGQTDAEGFAQIEVMKGNNLTFKSTGGATCVVDTSTIDPEEGVAYEDTVVCQ